MLRGCAVQAVLEAESRRELADVVSLCRRDQRDADALRSRAARTADAVNVCLAVGGRIEVDHVRDSADVNPAGRHIRGDERVDRPALESCERLLALAL